MRFWGTNSEVHNAGDSAVDLGGWYLTDDAGELDKWQFPERSLSPGEMMIVFASGKDRRDSTGVLHTNFSLKRARISW